MDMTRGLAYNKPEPRKRVQGRKRRAEDKVLAQVRREVFARDGGCRAYGEGTPLKVGRCAGRLELAHLFRRSASRGLPDAVRHNAREAVCLCSLHHGREERHELTWRYLSTSKAAGPMEWTVRP